jgi:hypothetical protein
VILMWMQIAWRSDLAISECEQRLGNMPRRSFLVTRGGSPLVVARPSGRLFRLFVAGGPTRVLFAPYFYGFLIDRHGATEIRGRLFPSPVAQAAVFLCVFVLVLLGLAVANGVFASSLSVLLFVFLTIGAALATLGWRTGRQGSNLITASIENAFRAHRLTSEWSRRAAES